MDSLEFARTQYTTVKRIKQTVAFFQANPKGRVKVDWCTSWNQDQFQEWFLQCLHNKINSHTSQKGRKYSKEWQRKMAGDAQQINRYYGQRIRHTGCHGLLSTSEMKAKYPHIDCQERGW